MTAGSRRRWAALLGVAGAVVLGVLLLRGGARPQPVVARDEPPASNPPPRSLTPAARPAPLPAAAPEKREPEAPIIDAITIEKQEVCRGEENLVTVRAHAANPADDSLVHAVIGGKPGSQVSLRNWDSAGDAEPTYVTVFGRNGTVSSQPVPRYKVKDCETPRWALIEFQVLENTWAEMELRATVKTPPSRDLSAPPRPAFKPARYEWTFGDGQGVSGASAVVTHSYEDRRQDRAFSEFLVGVKITSAAGEEVIARQTLKIPNPAHETFDRKKIVLLMHQSTPRFPEVDSQGVVSQRVRLWHAHAEPVNLSRLTMRIVHQDDGQPPEFKDVDPVFLLGTRTVPPGRGIELPVRLDTKSNGQVAYVDYALEGVTSDGFEARGSFSIMRPTPPPTRESHEPVTDPVLVAKIMAAKAVLHRPVTRADLARLEREGAFDNLPRP